jgi:hypothetical protein
MTNSAFAVALLLGATILVLMAWIANVASFRQSIRHRRYLAARAHAAEANWGAASGEDQPELDLEAGPEARQREHA